MKGIKCVEYYYDSNTYTRSELIENFNQEKEKYFDKIVDIDINLNEWGVYVVTLEFKNKRKYFQKKSNNIIETEKKEKVNKKALVKKKPSVIKKYYEKVLNIIEKFKSLFNKKEKIEYESKLDKYYQTGKNKKIEENRKKLESNYNKKIYGQYKETKTFKPY